MQAITGHRGRGYEEHPWPQGWDDERVHRRRTVRSGHGDRSRSLHGRGAADEGKARLRSRRFGLRLDKEAPRHPCPCRTFQEAGRRAARASCASFATTSTASKSGQTRHRRGVRAAATASTSSAFRRATAFPAASSATTFSGGGASHGSMIHRQPASNGDTNAGRTVKGSRRPGHYGVDRTTHAEPGSRPGRRRAQPVARSRSRARARRTRCRRPHAASSPRSRRRRNDAQRYRRDRQGRSRRRDAGERSTSDYSDKSSHACSAPSIASSPTRAPARLRPRSATKSPAADASRGSRRAPGRARQGSIRSPQWRHGGVVFGPQPRSYVEAPE